MDLTLKRMYEPTKKVALQIHSWQVDANIFKVRRYSLLRDFYLAFCSLLRCRLQRKVKITEECIAHYFECISIYLPTVNL